MKKFIGIALALVLSLSVFAGCGSDSGSNEDSSKAKEKYVIATDTTFAPFEFTNDDNEFVGIDAVSYTHLDVYKRQAWRCTSL